MTMELQVQRSHRVQRIHENDFVETGNWPQSNSELFGIVAVQRAVADAVLQSQPPPFYFPRSPPGPNTSMCCHGRTSITRSKR